MLNDLATQRMSVDQLLEVQAHQPFKGTIEAMDGSPETVKLTPWLPRAGCLCDMSVAIPAASIDSLIATDDVHLCCGKSLRVVEVGFVEGATIPVKDLFDQISARALAAAQRMEQRQQYAELLGHQARRAGASQGVTNVPFHT
jgi:hypothetical protein